MVAAGAVAHQAGRPVQDADAFERQSKRVGGHLRKGRFDALPERRRPDPEQYLPIGFDGETRVLGRSTATALHEAGDGDAMITPVDQSSLQRLLVLPAEFREATVQGRVVVAEIVGGFMLVGDERADRVGQFGGGDQVLAPELERIEAEVARDHVEQPLAKEVRLDPPGAR